MKFAFSFLLFICCLLQTGLAQTGAGKAVLIDIPDGQQAVHPLLSADGTILFFFKNRSTLETWGLPMISG